MEIAVEWIDCGCGHLVTSNLEAIGAVGDEMTVGVPAYVFIDPYIFDNT